MVMIVTDLSEKEQEFLSILRESDDWITRYDMAAKMGKRQLNPSEITVLEGMVESGLVERRQEMRGIRPGFFYREKQ